SRIRDEFAVELPFAAVFEAPTVGGLAARIDAAGPAETPPAIAPVRHDGLLPLSFAQERLWLVERLHPGGSAYNLPFAFRIDGELDVPALWLALSEIVRRHEALRAVFLEGQGGPRQRILPFAPLAAREVDLAGLRAAHRTAERDRLLREEEGRPFDLARGPLLR